MRDLDPGGGAQRPTMGTRQGDETGENPAERGDRRRSAATRGRGLALTTAPLLAAIGRLFAAVAEEGGGRRAALSAGGPMPPRPPHRHQA
jgi:hypothetical protein